MDLKLLILTDGQYRFAMGKEQFIDTLAKDFPAERNGLTEYMSKNQGNLHGHSFVYLIRSTIQYH